MDWATPGLMAPFEPQIAVLHRISNIVSSDLSLEQMLRELVALTVQVTGCDACLVYLADQSSGEVVLRGSQLPHDSEIGHIRFKMGEGITGWVALHRSVVALTEHAWQDSRFKLVSALPEDTFEAFLSAPLVSGGGLVGVINVHHRERHAHTPEEVALLTFLGEQIGGAIALSTLAQRSSSALRRIEALSAVNRAISAESYLDRILQTIAATLAQSFDVPLCTIWLADDDRRELTAKASNDAAEQPAVKMDESELGRVLLEGRTLVLDDGALLAAPLFARDKATGAITVHPSGPRSFDEDDIEFLQVVAGLAAIAVENARLMSETEEMKRTLETRKLVERAKGILQYKHNLTEEEAYLRLRNESRRLRRPMRDLAEAVILADDMSRT